MPDTAESPLTLEIVREPGAAVVLCRGRLVAGQTESFYAEIRALIPGTKRIVLDLTDLTHMDSSGLGTVVRLYVSAKAAGSSLELINLGKRVRQILSVANLLSFFAIVGEHDVRLP